MRLHDVSGVVCACVRVGLYVCVCHANRGSALGGDGKVLTKVQMKDGGSRGHRQTVMKQQCDLQLAGPIKAEQRSPHETLTTLENLHFTASPNIGIHLHVSSEHSRRLCRSRESSSNFTYFTETAARMSLQYM